MAMIPDITASDPLTSSQELELKKAQIYANSKNQFPLLGGNNYLQQMQDQAALNKLAKEGRIPQEAASIQAFPTTTNSPTTIQEQQTESTKAPSGAPISRSKPTVESPSPVISESQAPDISGLTAESDQATKQFLAGDELNAEMEQQRKDVESMKSQIIEKENEFKKTQDEVANFKWDNSSLWDKSSTGQKIALLIGGALSSVSPSSAQAFQKSVESALDKDMAQQKLKYDSIKDKGKSAENHLGQLIQRLGSEENGLLALRGQQIQIIQNKLKAAQDNAQSKIVAMNAQKNWESLEIEKGKLAIQLQESLKKNAGDIKNISMGPYKGYVGDEVSAREFRKKYNAVETANQTISDLKNLTKQGASISPEARAQAQSKLAVLVQQSKDILGTGVLSDSEREAVLNAIGDPTSIFSLKSSTLAKLQSFQKQLNQMVQQDAKSLGLYKEIGVNK